MTRPRRHRQLIERDHDLARLREVVAEGGRSAAVCGEAGIGKSRLLRTIRDLTTRDQLVLSAGGAASQAEVPWALASALLAPLGWVPPTDADLPPGAPPEGMLPLIAHQRAVIALSISSRSLLLVDDLHWVDRPSLALLGMLASSLPASTTLITATRDTNAFTDPERCRLIGALQAEATVLRPLTLTEAGVRDLLIQRHAPADSVTVARAWEQTGGLPLLVELLADDFGRSDPASETPAAGEFVRHGVGQRIATLSQPARAVLPLIAAWDNAPPEGLCDLLGLSASDLDLALGELTAAGMIRPGARLTIRHALIAHAIEELTPPAESARLHRLVAAQLSAMSASAHDVGRHLLKLAPGEAGELIESLPEAARVSLMAGDTPAALRLVERAEAEPGLPEEIAHRLVLVRRVVEASSSGEAAERAADRTGPPFTDPDWDAWAARDITRSLIAAGRVRRAFELYDDVQPHIKVDPALISLMCLTLGMEHPDEHPEAVALLERCYESTPAPDSPSGLRLRIQRAQAEAYVGADEEAAVLLTGLDGRLVVDSLGPFAPELFVPPGTAALIERPDLAEHYLAGAWAACAAQPEVRGCVQLWRARAAMDLGEVAEARERLADAERSGWWPIADGVYVWTAVEAALAADATAAATRALDRPCSDSPLAYLRRLGVAEHAMSRGDHRAAWAAFEGLDLGSFLNRTIVTLVAAEAVAECDPARARQLLAEAAAIGDYDRPLRSMHRLRVEARLAGGSAASWQQALDVLNPEIRWHRLPRARLLVTRADAVRRERRLAEAKEAYAEALELADVCSAHALARAAREGLALLGLAPRRTQRVGAQALTTAEQRVVRGALDGLSNGEIAAKLGVSRRTVENQLASCYRKLGIPGRSQLKALEPELRAVHPISDLFE